MRFIYSHWQGDDYTDGIHGFHTDYSTFSLQGFTLLDIGNYRVSPVDGWMTFIFADEKDLINARSASEEEIHEDIKKGWEEAAVYMTLNSDGELQFTEVSEENKTRGFGLA
jgi:hypothetical protein